MGSKAVDLFFRIEVLDVAEASYDVGSPGIVRGRGVLCSSCECHRLDLPPERTRKVRINVSGWKTEQSGVKGTGNEGECCEGLKARSKWDVKSGMSEDEGIGQCRDV